MDGIEGYKAQIKANIGYGILVEQRPNDRELIDSYVELLAEACASRRKTIRISREDFPTEVVRSRFLKLNSEHIGYVLDCMKQTASSIGNIKAYTLAALYNAPVTMGQYYTALVNRDFAAEGGDEK